MKTKSSHHQHRAWFTGACLFMATVMVGCGFASGARFTSMAEPVVQMTQEISLPPIDANALVDAVRIKTIKTQGLDRSPLTTPCAFYVGGIVNHHVLATDLLMQFMFELKRCRPELKRMIILSPDHFLQSRTAFAIHERPYLVQSNLIQVATSSVKFLKKSKQVADQPHMFDMEHGIAVPVWFAAQVYPKLEIVPIAVKADLNRDQVQDMVEWLTSESAQGTFILVSSDMSHYLQDVVALNDDEETRLALSKNNQDFFWNAADNHTDNGKSIWLALSSFKNPSWQELGHSISSRYGGSTRLTTTYINGFWSTSSPSSHGNE